MSDGQDFSVFEFNSSKVPAQGSKGFQPGKDSSFGIAKNENMISARPRSGRNRDMLEDLDEVCFVLM